MTYCLGLYLKEGLVMLADTRTNAGVDNFSTYSKTFVWERPGERVITLMAAGNLAVTQAVVNTLEEGLVPAGAVDGGPQTMLTTPSLFQAARLVGQAVRCVYSADAEAMQKQETAFTASFLLGGQISGQPMHLFQVYTAGNFISATPDTPFLQIGEHKYGKPILIRALSHGSTTLMDGVKLALVSMDSTVRSNLSVGFPLDLVAYRRDSLSVTLRRRIEEDDPYVAHVSAHWSEALRSAYQGLPVPDWQGGAAVRDG